MNLVKSAIIFLFFIGYASTFGQEINGKWIKLKNPEAYVRPSINVLEFNESKLIQYDFNEKIDSTAYKVVGDSVDMGKVIKTYKFINEDILELTGKATYNGRDTIMSERFLKITATKSELPELGIQKESFSLFWNGVNNIIAFNNFQSTNDFQISMFKICKDVRLEKLDLMMFISVFCENKREFVFPIKNINKKSLTVIANGFKELNVPLKNTNHNNGYK
ncbi:hypothetical protein [Maribacter sp. IgM3_T14_3]|uniref:hypothetical protein n=1 Tax=Maribacter sp. IgM3_T14_3 TaxID=3415140 RepID=UPI003C6EF0F7